MKTGLICRIALPGLRHKLAEREVAPLLLELAPQDADLAAALPARQPLPMGLCNQCPVVLEQVEIELPEPLDDLLVRIAIEFGQRRIVMERRRDQHRQPGVLEERSEVRAGVLPGQCGIDHRAESDLCESRFLLVEPNDFREGVQLLARALKPDREVGETTIGQRCSRGESVVPYLKLRSHGLECTGECVHRGATAVGVTSQRRPVGSAVEYVVNGIVECTGRFVGMQFDQPERDRRLRPPRACIAVDRRVGKHA